MPFKEDLKKWVLQAIDANKGSANLIDVAKYIWDNHESDLRSSGEGFYTWQYDMRWAAQALRDEGILANADSTPRGIWQRRKITT
jgi:hypothetical protein